MAIFFHAKPQCVSTTCSLSVILLSQKKSESEDFGLQTKGRQIPATCGTMQNSRKISWFGAEGDEGGGKELIERPPHLILKEITAFWVTLWLQKKKILHNLDISWKQVWITDRWGHCPSARPMDLRIGGNRNLHFLSTSRGEKIFVGHSLCFSLRAGLCFYSFLILCTGL